jgi:hypothetical protein
VKGSIPGGSSEHGSGMHTALGHVGMDAACAQKVQECAAADTPVVHLRPPHRSASPAPSDASSADGHGQGVTAGGLQPPSQPNPPTNDDMDEDDLAAVIAAGGWVVMALMVHVLVPVQALHRPAHRPFIHEALDMP